MEQRIAKLVLTAVCASLSARGALAQTPALPLPWKAEYSISASPYVAPKAPFEKQTPASTTIPIADAKTVADDSQPTQPGLEQVLQWALEYNPALVEAQAKLESAQGNWVQVGLLPNPVVSYVGTEIGQEGQAGQQGFQVQQQIVTAGKLRLSREAASRGVLGAEVQLTQVQFRILTDVRIAFYRTLISQRAVQLVQRLVEVNEKILDDAQLRLRSGEGKKVDMLRARNELQQTELLLIGAQNQLASHKQQLDSVIGNPVVTLPLSGDSEKDLPRIEWESARRRILEENPTVQRAEIELERRRWQLQRAIAQRTPNLQLVAGTQYDAATEHTITSVGVQVPLMVFNRNQGGILQASGNLTASQRALERLRLSLTQQLASVYREYDTARQSADKYRDQLLPTAKETLELVQLEFHNGETTFLDVVTAQRAYVQATIDYFKVLQRTWDLGLEIDGLLLTGSLSTPIE